MPLNVSTTMSARIQHLARNEGDRANGAHGRADADWATA
jgi:hypothetical protein